MKPRAWLFPLLLATFSLGQAQQSSAGGTAPASEGVTAAWDVRDQMQALATDVRKLDPLLGYIKPSDWIKDGAPDAYVRQLASAQASLSNLIASTSQLAQQPEKLSLALETLFQMERVELLLSSLREGVQKYQSPDLANMMSQTFAAQAVHRERLRQHVRDLALIQEQEFQIASEEAQRCRSLLTKPASAAEQRPARKSSSPQK